MPSKSKLQHRFFNLVNSVQQGLIHPSGVSTKIRKAAKSISRRDVHDFVNTPEKGLPYKIKKEIISTLKELQEPMYLNENEINNAIAKTFNQKAKYDDYVKKFIGVPFLPKELDAINNFKELSPTKIDKNQVLYENTDDFGSTTTTTIKKLKENNQFVYTAFTKYEQVNQQKEEEPTDQPSDLDTIVIIKSQNFQDEISGANVLSNFLKRIDL